MGKIKILFLEFCILILLSSMGALCSYTRDTAEFIKDLNDLKAEVNILENQLNGKKDQRDKLQKEIAQKDYLLKDYQNRIDTVKKRCP